MDQNSRPSPDGDVRRWRARLREGDVAAYTELFRTYVDQVHRLAAALCGDRSLAEDVTGETFLVAWRRRAVIADSDDPLGPWLLAIAARQALNSTRGRRRQHRLATRFGHRAPAALPDIADTVSDRLDSAELLERTQRALQHLSPRELEVLALCVWSGLTTREAAQALEVSESTVRSRLHRARTRLRALTNSAAGASTRPTPARPAFQEH